MEEPYEIDYCCDIKREGKDVTIVTYSAMVDVSLKAAEQLAEEGIEAEVVDIRTLEPLDTETIVNSVKKTRHAVVVHEACQKADSGRDHRAGSGTCAGSAGESDLTRGSPKCTGAICGGS
ncbi:MAG: transketolase C-terminal domain-containing protein [[Clostridium] scindens]